MLGIGALFFDGLKSGRTAVYRTTAVYLAADMADRIKANILPAILEAAKSEDEDGTERTWMMRLMAGLMGLVGAGQGVSGIRGFLLKRGMAKVKEKLGAA